MLSRPAFWLSVLVASSAFMSKAQAQIAVCSHSRPNWDSDLGDATWLSEALHIVTSSGVIALFIVMVLAVQFKNFWFTTVVSLAALVICYFFYNAWTVADPQSVMFRSIVEGCVGPPYGGIVAILVAISIMIGWQFFGKPKQNDEGENA